MKTYDYADETKDVKGKVRVHLTIIEWENQCHKRASKSFIRIEECHDVNHPQSRWGYANDRVKYFQATSKY